MSSPATVSFVAPGDASQAPGTARALRGTLAMAGLLGFAPPMIFFSGALSVGSEAATALGLWFLLFGLTLSLLLLGLGEALMCVAPSLGRAQTAASLLAACAAASVSSVVTAGRAVPLLDAGVVTSVTTMHLYAFTLSATVAHLYFVHLRRRRAHEAAAARLASAQAAQRNARLRLARARLAAVQARVDPGMLMNRLDAVRCAYAEDPVRAEQLLDELIAFLRAALPRLNREGSSVAQEVELVRAFVRLIALGGAPAAVLTHRIAPEAREAACPPGLLLPLADDALRLRAGACAIAVDLASRHCRLTLTLPAQPTVAALDRARALLHDLHGDAASLHADGADDGDAASVRLVLDWPHGRA